MLYIINAACVDHEGHLSLIPFYFVSHKKIIVDDFEKEFPKNKYKNWTYKKKFFTRTDVKSILDKLT